MLSFLKKEEATVETDKPYKAMHSHKERIPLFHI